MAKNETVVKVIDGDTFQTKTRIIRLTNVDTPEKGQKGYQDAKQALKDLIQGEIVTITTKGKDSYGRSLGDVKINGHSVNKAMKKHEK